MKRIIPLFAGLLVLLILAPLAWAQNESSSSNAVTNFTELAFQILTVVLPIIAVWLTHRGLAVFEKKSGINVPDSIESRIDGWIEEGIHLAAEKARQKIRAKTAELTGPEKLEEAAQYVFDLAQSRGWIEWTKVKIKNKIEAHLGIHRANGGVPKFDE